ncbi:putative siderophore transport system ATP-binding protein YusV [Marinobacter litoralis]|uniref:Putative siderophore transport system ATP-binding protein YusV n=1 Tax=Marinobacter litoralis TaxID=187981 RepID=A0A3M2RM17_9GAMM|nr:ABC transporter ATP-binding protein [Marinobacter litoralis]RMJ06338.1 putative siderophore transport system ATP-binding protein YusV [Marinobacter litoralis]
MIQTENLSLAYGATPVVNNVSLAIPEGAITCLLGPNGSGKSTLLKSFAGLLPARSGRVLLDGQPLNEWDRQQLALRLAMLPQKPIVPDGILVKDLVTLGRFPHRKWWQKNQAEDNRIAHDSMAMTGVAELADRPVEALSGGQQQRVWIAMALAQETSILLLDEPTTFLDWGYQLEVLELLAKLNREQGLTVVMSLHDLNQAAQFADHIAIMAKGELQAIGSPSEVITESLIQRVFRVETKVTSEANGRPFCSGYAAALKAPEIAPT